MAEHEEKAMSGRGGFQICVVVSVLLAEAGEVSAGRFCIVRDGHPMATILIASNPSRTAQFSARELRYHIEKITGVCLPVAHEGAEVTGARILVGESTETRKLGLHSTEFKEQEYAIRFIGNTLILIGRDDPRPTYPVSLYGELKWTQGKFGGALEFDGKGAVVFTDPGFSDDEGTLEAWVRIPAEAQKGSGTILRLDGRNPWTYHIVERRSNKIVYVTYDGKKGSGIHSKPLLQGWHHILATYSVKTGEIELFIDGVSYGKAKYSKTTCSGSALMIGGLVRMGGKVIANTFAGIIDEVRISARSRADGNITNQPSPDNSTRVLLHFDEGGGVPKDSSGFLRPASPPDWFEPQGSSYAVHDFLERFCDVRWYAPTELGIVHPRRRTLSVKRKDIRRRPAFLYRFPYPPFPTRGMVRTLWNNPTARDLRLFWARLRAGGERYACNHSFYGYYDRFWEKNPNRPQLFEKPHREWFAQGWKGKPPQMCFTNEDFIGQVVQDARDYFDGKGLKPGAIACGDYFALVPMDNNRWCKCEQCQSLMNQDEKDNPQFSGGFASDYVFRFANRVAREIRKSHPDKFLSTIAYHDYAYHPQRVKLEPNISVQMCLHTRNWWVPSMKRNDIRVFKDWVKKEKGRRLYLWLYYCFPEGIAIRRGFHCFPGFFAHTAAKQIKIFAKGGIRGAFLNGLGEQVDTYITMKLFDDPRLDVDDLLEEFFRRYYGSAWKPMKRLYLRIERIYSNPRNYPKEVQKSKHGFHQTEEMAWGYLGTEERMRELGRLIEEAKRSARTEVERRRVALFEQGVWQYMVEGRKKYLEKLALEPFRQKLKAQPPPEVSVPRVPPAGGDPAKVEWQRAVVLKRWYTVDGYPTERKVSARLAHDGEYLYIYLQEQLEPKKLVSKKVIWSGDDWEIFIAPARRKPYSQLAIAPNGKYTTITYGSDQWNPSVRVVSDTSSKDRWAVSISYALRTLLPGGAKPGDRFFANFYRASVGASRLLAWSPNFRASFHELSRLGKFTLQ